MQNRIFLILCFALFACSTGEGPSGRVVGTASPDATTQTSTATTDAGSIDAGYDPCPTPELSSIREKTFVPTCGVSSCHTGTASTAAGLDLTLEVELLRIRLAQSSTQSAQGLKLIHPGRIGSSWLYLKLFMPTPPRGERMPPNATIEPCELSAIKLWIEADAND